ncbi:hypothetical protein GEV33_005784 [Tenebrio molitor]|uniref:Uncharacterized protein n=1 Tax=Tenebrio molitor TaxID=7067 RepID=A0A8J6HM88_TENMO|nr:hypothetical protein GEV33_005784 [Tenebrio molitor]
MSVACFQHRPSIVGRTHRDGNVHGLPPKNLRIEGAKAINRGNQRQKGKFTAIRGVGRRDDVVEFSRVVGDDSSKYNIPPPKSPSGSRTSLRKVPDRTFLRIRISSSPVSPGRPPTHRKVPDLPTSKSVAHRAIGGHHNFLRRFFIGLKKFFDSSCRPAVNPELTEGKGEEFSVLTLNGGRCNHFSVRKRDLLSTVSEDSLVGFASNRKHHQSTILVVRIVNRVEAHDLFVIPLNTPDL